MASTLQQEQRQRKGSDYPLDTPRDDKVSLQLDDLHADAMRQSGNQEVLIPGWIARFADDRAGASTLRHRYRDMHADLN